jgi:gluconolactonase
MIDRKLNRDWEKDNILYPDPAIEIIDEEFKKYVIGNAVIDRVFTGSRWAEGPAWFGDGRYLLFSDIPNNRILKWEEETEKVSEFRSPSNNANGNARDLQGRLITCEHLTRRVTRTEYDGSITILADNYEGLKLNSPNDVTIHKDGSVWFTDPDYGILGDYEGDKSKSEISPGVYRVDSITLNITKMETNPIIKPNGLCFSPDYKYIYIADSGALNPKVTYIYQVTNNANSLENGKIFINTGTDGTDGIRCDIDGNLWCSAQQGTNSISVYNPNAKLIGRIYLPEKPSNLTFGGIKKNRLFITASKSVYSIYVGAKGSSLS